MVPSNPTPVTAHTPHLTQLLRRCHLTIIIRYYYIIHKYNSNDMYYVYNQSINQSITPWKQTDKHSNQYRDVYYSSQNPLQE